MREMKSNIWTQIEHQFNSKSSTFRSAESLRTKFRNMKKDCKKIFDEKKTTLRTGGGPPSPNKITSLDLEMPKELMGATCVEGLVAIDDDDYEDNRMICRIYFYPVNYYH
jgi:hypothetical protein